MDLTIARLKQLSLGVALFGSGFLVLIALVQEPVTMKMEDITSSEVGKRIRIEGKVDEVVQGENWIRFGMQNEGQVKVILFNPTFREQVLVEERAWLIVIGRVDRYQGALEVIGEEVREIDGGNLVGTAGLPGRNHYRNDTRVA